MAFPSVLSSFPRPSATDRLNSPSHSNLHNTVSSAVGQLEAVIGVEGDSSVVGTLEYLIKSPASDGGGHVQVANKGGTGQTNYNKGDVLVAQSSSVLTKLSVGTDGFALTSDSTQITGVTWSGVAKLDYQAFSVTGTWTKPVGISPNALVVVQLWGAGASGGRAAAANSGSGGGGGGFTQGFFKASILGATENVTIGTGGIAITVDNTNGNPGGTTVFGASSILTAWGAGAGSGSNAGQGNGGGGGGGISSVGSNGSNGSGGNGGLPNPFFGVASSVLGLGGGTSRVGVDNIYGGGGGAGPFTQNGGSAFYGGGGGGGGATNGAGGIGGSTTYGGGGGGGGGNSGGLAGNSFFGGNGGNGGSSPAAGTAPGGGGGGSNNGTNSGAGARGEARIWIV